jgi:hypothetical protein
MSTQKAKEIADKTVGELARKANLDLDRGDIAYDIACKVDKPQ